MSIGPDPYCCIFFRIFLNTVFSRIVSVETILFWKWKMRKFLFSFRVMAIFYFINWTAATETIQGGNYSREETIRGNMVDIFKVIYIFYRSNKICESLWPPVWTWVFAEILSLLVTILVMLTNSTFNQEYLGSLFSNFFCMFLNPNIFFPVWILIVLIYYVLEFKPCGLKF